MQRSALRSSSVDAHDRGTERYLWEARGVRHGGFAQSVKTRTDGKVVASGSTLENVRNIECKTDNHNPLLVPGVQATEHQTKALGDRTQTQAVGDHERRWETESPEWLQPFTEGLTK